METDEWRSDTSDVVHAIASGATGRQIERALGVERATVAKIRSARRRRIARLRALHSDTATIEHVREQECAARDRAQAAEPEARGTEVRSDLAPLGSALITNWKWIKGTLRLAGESAFAPGQESTDWRSCWQTLASTSEGAEVSLTAYDGEGIDALLRAAPREGDVLLVRNAGISEDWIWTVFAKRGTTVENLGADATMTKPAMRGTSRMGVDIRTVLRAVEG